MTGTSRVIAIAASVLSGLTLALLAPSAAHAADDVVLVSLDGAAFSAGASGAVLTDIARMVPGDSQTGSFFVRNAGDEPGFLRIVLRDIDYTDAKLAQAVTLAADTITQDGVPTPMSFAEPCWVLSEGEVIAAGATTRVDLTAAVGQLVGRDGQNATVTANLGIALSDTTPGSLSPTDCGGLDVNVPVTPRDSPRTPPAGTLLEAAPSQSGGLVPNSPDLPVLNLPGLLGIDPNTWHLLEEYWVLVPLGSLVFGSLGYLLIVRRRSKDETEPA